MQIMIDTDTETVAGLLALVNMLEATLTGRNPSTSGEAPPLRHNTPRINVPTPPPLPPGSEPKPLPVVPAGTMPQPDRFPDLPDPAVVFGGAAEQFSNFPATGNPPLPPLAVAMAPAVNPASLPSAPSTGGAATASDMTATATLPTSAAGSPGVTIERDKEGIVWDARVHSETRKKNADGTWRFRRNLDADVKAAVYAELKGQSAVSLPQQSAAGLPGALPVPPAAAPLPVPPAAAAPLPLPVVPAAGGVPADTVSLPAPMQLPTGNPAGLPNTTQPVVVSPVTSFRDLMQKVQVAVLAGTFTQAQLNDAVARAGVTGGLTALAAQPMLVPAVDAEINRLLGVA